MIGLLQRAVLAGAFACLVAPAHAQPAPTQPAPTQPAPTRPAPPADSIDKLSQTHVVAVLGLAAHGADGKEVGRIVDVLVDQSGKPRAAVIDAGGFMGMGNRKVAVDWAAIRFSMGKQAFATLGIASDLIKSAPVYDPGKPVQAIEMPEPRPAAPDKP